MPTYFESFIFRDENEHDLEHDMSVNDQFSNPKIYTANGDITKRWYVYFSYRNPNTGKLERMKNIYGKTNRYKTKEKRYQVLSTYRKNLLKLLKQGYNPFEDNTTLYERHQQEAQKVQNKKLEEDKVVDTILITNTKKPSETVEQQTQPIEDTVNSLSIKEALELGLKLKSKIVSNSTFADYKGKIKRFRNWLESNHPDVTHCQHLNKKIASEFLNGILINSSPRNRNNYRTELSSVFQVLKENEIIAENYFMQIKKLKTKAEIHKVYDKETLDKIYEHLEKNDPILLLFIKFLGISLMRPVEICRLKVGDINLKERTIQFKAKNKPLKTKILPQMLLDELPDLSKMNKEHYLFTPDKIGGEWDTTETNKRGYFTNRFKQNVKDEFNLSREHTLYGFRHTYISKIYKKLRETNSPNKAKSELMFITGHSTMKALEFYLRSIDAELPEDYSHLLQ